jgi:hypothetical protein
MNQTLPMPAGAPRRYRVATGRAGVNDGTLAADLRRDTPLHSPSRGMS